ncbi:hypothetical protein M3G91_10190 [Micromonospora chalcea]|uniref:hypothetical protein n=1 Tax=Micromonospora chalcea TaxID=1874 RepID=UPI0021A62727|nr:hypothetical protein [Micromonospora chalcea]MCT2277994.1 hypothetical protein [Micromonospora chalcea]
MSLQGDRKAIADALSTVVGVTGYAKRPTTRKAGDGWPLLSSLERAAGLSFTVTWRVLILLPQDETKASEWIDVHHEDLVDALEQAGFFVDRLEPVVLAASGADQYALQISMRSE